jgi:hypothetical protein
MNDARALSLMIPVLGCGMPTDGGPPEASPSASISASASAGPPGRLAIEIVPAHSASKPISGRVHVSDRSSVWSGAAVTFDGLAKTSHEVRVDGGLFADPIRVDMSSGVGTEVTLDAFAASVAGPPNGHVMDVSPTGVIAFSTEPGFSLDGFAGPEEAIDLSRLSPSGASSAWTIRIQPGTSMKHVLPVVRTLAARSSGTLELQVEQPWLSAPEAETKQALAAGRPVTAAELAACDGQPPEGGKHYRYRPCSAELRAELWLRHAVDRASSDAREGQRAFYLARALHPKITVGDDATGAVKDAYAAAKKQGAVKVVFSLASATADHVAGGAAYEKHTEAVRDIVRAEEPAIRYCYASTLVSDEPPRKTSARLTFHTRPDGTPYWVGAEASPQDDALVACLERIANGLTFAPTPKIDGSTIRLELSTG